MASFYEQLGTKDYYGLGNKESYLTSEFINLTISINSWERFKLDVILFAMIENEQITFKIFHESYRTVSSATENNVAGFEKGD